MMRHSVTFQRHCNVFHDHWRHYFVRQTTLLQTQPFNGPLPGTTQVGRYQKEHSPTHTHPDHRSSFINFLHLLGSTASSLFSLRAWQSFPQTLSRSSLVFLLVWNSLLHTFLHPITIFLQRYVVIVYVCKC